MISNFSFFTLRIYKGEVLKGDAAKAAANYITTADNDHDGLAEMLERFVL